MAEIFQFPTPAPAGNEDVYQIFVNEALSQLQDGCINDAKITLVQLLDLLGVSWTQKSTK